MLQSGQGVAFAGEVNTRGGVGSRLGEMSIPQIRAEAEGGDGAPGFFRLEAPAGAVTFGGSSTPTFVGGVNDGLLLDRDDRSGDTSLWYATGLVFPPTWDRYELDVDEDGDGVVDITYTDSGAPGTIKAAEAAGPITLPLVILFQGATMDQLGSEPVGPLGPWREGVGSGGGPGISLDAVTGFRFRITYNRALAPDLVVVALRVFAST